MRKTSMLVTGGMGFIGSNFVNMMHRTGRFRITVIDNMTYAADRNNLEPDVMGDLDGQIYCFDISNVELVTWAMQAANPEIVVNFAAESHVDRSIASSSEFIRSNVVGVQVLLDASRGVGVRRFVQISTDEVYGDLGMNEAPSKEEDNLRPSSPYSASKAAADLLVLAYVRTFGMDAIITRCVNNYGPRQYPEKLIPLAIKKLLSGEKVPVYGRGENIRDWIHVDDHCRGILAAIERGEPGWTYNFGGDLQVKNIDLVGMLISLTGAREDQIEYVQDRPGHDTRYDLNDSRAKLMLGWERKVRLGDGLRDTVEWYKKKWNGPVV